MNSSLEKLVNKASKKFQTSFSKYLDSNGAVFEVDEIELFAYEQLLVDFLKEHQENTPETKLVLQFLLEVWGLDSVLMLDSALIPMLQGRLQEGLDLIVKNPEKKMPTLGEIADRMAISELVDWSPADSDNKTAIFKQEEAQFVWDNARSKIFEQCSEKSVQLPLMTTLTQRAPEEVSRLLESLEANGEILYSDNWVEILENTDSFDNYFIRSLPFILKTAQAQGLKRSKLLSSFEVNLAKFFELDRAEISKALIQTISKPPFLSSWIAITHLADHFEERDLLALIDGNVTMPYEMAHIKLYKKLARLAFENIDTVGLSYLGNAMIRTSFASGQYRTKIVMRLLTQPEEHSKAIKELLLKKVANFSAPDKLTFWKLAKKSSNFAPEIEALISSTSAGLRELSAQHLVSLDKDRAFELGSKLLTARKINERKGGILLLKPFGDRAIPLFEKAYQTEESEKVRDQLQQILGAILNTKEDPIDPTSLIAEISKDKRLKLPRLPWLDPEKLILRDPKSKPLPPSVITFIIKWQLKHKAIEASPQITPLLPLLTHPKNHAFVLALFSQFLNSDQAAKDRWVLTFAGLFGDDTIAPLLQAAINRWAKAKRKELAACAARALGLLGSDVALSILDDVAQTFRQKGANIGRAAAEAVQTAASARNLTVEQLRDEITPTLGFDSEDIFIMETEGESLHAQLQPSLDLLWLNPTSGKTTKNPSSKINPTLKKRATAFKRLLKDTIKNQSTRLERALVTQRRWSNEKWHQLFDIHPILSKLSPSLIWASYSGDKIETIFRRYANGIISSADGEMLDSENLGDSLGLVHPCDLESSQIEQWQEHLERQKITSIFPQLFRSIHRKDPSQANRKELTTIKDDEVLASTLLSRAEKLGWMISGRIENAMVPSIYKEFLTHNIDVNLEVENLCMAGLPFEDAATGVALFVKHGSIDRGEYACDIPNLDDPRVIAFGEIPAVVYSETINELKALIEGLPKA